MAEILTMPQTSQSNERPFEIVSHGVNIGAEIRDVRISGELDAATIAHIRATLLEHKVIFFRDQQHLDDAQQEAFASLFGELQKQPMAPAAGQSAALIELAESEAYAASTWHTDMTFMPEPAAFAVLRAMELPAEGGDTMWANTATGYQMLPAPLKPLAEGLWAIHSTDFDFDGTFTESYRARMRDYGANTKKHGMHTEHPVVQIHPETGERSLILGSWIKRFVGLNNADSAKIFEILQSYVTEPENTVRWKWRLGDVAMWDNRATQHRSVPDHGGASRRLRRATVLGSVPTAIDGSKSRPRAR